jgi:hypothetical protein
MWLIGKFRSQKELEMNGRMRAVLMLADVND